jgi:hypothetical protein
MKATSVRPASADNIGIANVGAKFALPSAEFEEEINVDKSLMHKIAATRSINSGPF